MANVINFYSTRDEFGAFSNFAKTPVHLGGRRWPTVEHYFQAQKFAGTEHEELIRAAKSAMIAARMGRDRTKPLRKDWDAVKEQVMLAGLRAKFSQHPDLATLLLSTADAVIVEHTANDSYWGDGGDGSGKNRLGHLLMTVREELRAATAAGDRPMT